MKQIAIAVTTLCVLTASAEAQPTQRKPLHVPRNEGLMLGGTTVLALGLSVQGPGMRGAIATSMGQGAGVQVGYGFTPRLMAFASADVAKQAASSGPFKGTFGLTHVHVGGRMTFAQPNRRALPYVTAFYGKHALAARSTEGGLDATLRISGTELGGGAGVLYALTPALSLDAGVNGGRGKFNNLALTGDVQSSGTVNVDPTTSLRLKVGFNWHPVAK